MRGTPWYSRKPVSLEKAKAGSIIKTKKGLFRIQRRPYCGKGYIIEFHPNKKGQMWEVFQKGKWKNFESIDEVRKLIKQKG